MKTDEKNVNALCHAFDLGKAEGLRVAKEKYLDADAYNEGIADGRESAIDECIEIVSRETHDATLCDYLEELKEKNG